MSKFRISAFLLCIILVLGLTACNDDDDVTCPEECPSAAEPTLANIWPHANGNAWTFDMTYLEHITTDTLQEPPASMETLHTLLQSPLPGTPDFSLTGLYRIALDGEITTDSGVTAQHIQETLFFDNPDREGKRTSTGQNTPDRLLRLIARARPDLRREIHPLLDGESKDMDTMTHPWFIGGYTFASEDDGYFGYGDLDQNHSWIYLGSNLETGGEFSLQLIPSIADDIWLYGRIWSRGDLTVGGRQFENVVECMYLIDLGETTATDENGNIIGTFNSYMYGTVHFAPEVGPIKGMERHLLGADQSLMGGEPIAREHLLELVGATQAD